MINLDESLQRAALGAATWSAGIAREVAANLARGPASEIDWDEGAGENWLRVIDGDQVVGLVSAVLPFSFVQRSEGSLGWCDKEVVVVVVDDFDDLQLSCSPSVLCGVFGSSERLKLLDLDGFSVSDLWYSTV